MPIAHEIIDLLGGIRPLARELSFEPPSIVQGWKDRGTIPVKHWPAIIEVAKKRGVDLTADHLSGLEPVPANPPADAPPT